MNEALSPFSSTPSFALQNFEGPLELLLYLIQKEEVDIREIFLFEITTQFQQELEKKTSLDLGADFLPLMTTLLLLKCRKLLPTESLEPQSEEEMARWEIFQHLMDYCQFREVAEDLSVREESQRFFFPRGVPPLPKEELPLETVPLETLASVFQEIWQRAKAAPGLITAEEWKVGPMMAWLRETIKETSLYFSQVFSASKCRQELIVLFLALLELMKSQEVRLIPLEGDFSIEKGI